MRSRFLALFAATAAGMALAGPAHAQDARVASTHIFSGAYDKAEAKLSAALQANPDRPELLLNLAAVYSQTGRAAEARALYARVLAQEDVLMDLPNDRVVGSHAIARKGLGRLDSIQLSAR